MKDDATKKAGPPHSLSRKEEKANKRNTKKKRRQMDKKSMTLKEFIVQESAPARKLKQMRDDTEIECPWCGGTGAMWSMGDRDMCDECWGEGKIKPSELSPRAYKHWEESKRRRR